MLNDNDDEGIDYNKNLGLFGQEFGRSKTESKTFCRNLNITLVDRCIFHKALYFTGKILPLEIFTKLISFYETSCEKT